MNYIVFDIETQNLFQDVGSSDPAALDLSVISLYDSKTKTYTSATIDTLENIWPILETADALVGYNSNHFDIQLLNKYYPGDITHIKSIDLLEDIKASFGRRLRLDDVAKATIGAKKNADGLQAVRWWREGKVDLIIKYCEQDVKVTKEVFEYALNNGHVKIKDGFRKREIPIDTTHWKEKDDDAAITHSLLF